jgi:hypothetical protein
MTYILHHKYRSILWVFYLCKDEGAVVVEFVMDQYRVYTLDEQRRVCGVQILEGETVEEIIFAAQHLDPTVGLEIWLNERCVAELPSERR